VYDPFAWELSRPGGGSTMNLVHLLRQISKTVSNVKGGGGDAGKAAFWETSEEGAERDVFDMLRIHSGMFGIGEAAAVYKGLPLTPEAINSETWKEGSALWRVIQEAEARGIPPDEQHDWKEAKDWALTRYPQLNNETRSSIDAHVWNTLNLCNRGNLRKVLSGQSTWQPELLEQGCITFIDPGEMAGTAEAVAQGTIFKYMTQRWLMGRAIHPDTPPVQLLVDEFHRHCTEWDADFQATYARSARCLTCYATQTIANVEKALGGGDIGKAAASALNSNLAIKIFTRCITDHEHNQQSASMCGIGWREVPGWTINAQPAKDQMDIFPGRMTRSRSRTVSLQQTWMVDPHVFQHLQAGGPPDFEVGAIVAGKIFSNGEVWIPVTFKQKG
jgi:hypothetical protein